MRCVSVAHFGHYKDGHYRRIAYQAVICTRRRRAGAGEGYYWYHYEHVGDIKSNLAEAEKIAFAVAAERKLRYEPDTRSGDPAPPPKHRAKPHRTRPLAPSQDGRYLRGISLD
jgi:hypothetical protein